MDLIQKFDLTEEGRAKLEAQPIDEEKPGLGQHVSHANKWQFRGQGRLGGFKGVGGRDRPSARADLRFVGCVAVVCSTVSSVLGESTYPVVRAWCWRGEVKRRLRGRQRGTTEA